MKNIYEAPEAVVVEFVQDDLLDESPIQTQEEGGPVETGW